MYRKYSTSLDFRYWVAADELLSNSLTESSELRDDTNVNWKQGISGRSTGYYGNQLGYSHLPSSHDGYSGYSKISSRDSASHSIGTPSHSTSAGINSYSSLSGSSLSTPGYASYSQGYPSPAYSAPSYPSAPISSYPVPNYGPEDLAPHDYEEHHQEKNKFAKKHLALGISLPLILGPLVVIGIVALLNFRAVFTVLVIRSLCTNGPFRTNFGQLCSFVDNINKRSSDDVRGFKNMGRRSQHKYSRLMSLLNSAKFIAMEHLNTLAEE
ncbi:hypothetical protein DAPPUDRAFT_236275 [Daphnia pulex]|uniref:Uncharacterized protein n=1 Tax=Daphnia pulex TaxID=6669 RepID=E9G1M8_DAPPU|nr:hypothetical protein DAPPUDRAFT_236275 [Daphnia pulex]|eukprot:EFX86784.1 hypothetical protein DAPPUDRAFT_236275 [Daphnia pulex]